MNSATQQRSPSARHGRRPYASSGAFAPDSLTVGARHLEVSGQWVSSFAITGYPREVRAGWLTPLTTYPGRLDVSVHVEPVDPAVAATHLKRQLARLESGRRHTAEHGRLADPRAEAATEDAYDLSDRIARGECRLFRLGLYLTVHASTEGELADEVAAVRSLCASLLLDAKPATYRSMQGWVTTLPMGLDLLGMTRTFDTSALAAAFPFTSPDLPPADAASVAAPSGVLYGYNLGSQGLVHWDRFAHTMHNHNSVVLGRSGAGKSYLVKLELLRSLYRGIETMVIDPEDEYTRLGSAVGATTIRLGSPGVRLNPFDLAIHTRPDGRRAAPADALARRSLFLHTVLEVVLGRDLTPEQRAAADSAITTTYHRAGITENPRTWNRPAPLLRDLRDTLAHADSAEARELAGQLHPFVDGAFRDLFAGPTTTQPDGHLVLFSLRELADELRPAATLLTLDVIWRRVANAALRRPRLIVVDEGWLLLQQKAGAQFLFRMAKAARKHWAGLTVATQDAADVLGSDLGQAVVANAATQILLRQAPQTIDAISQAFHLSDGERAFLLAAEQGHGLLAHGSQRVAFASAASPFEHDLITSSPAELDTTTAGHEHVGDEPTDPARGDGYVDLGPADDEEQQWQ